MIVGSPCFLVCFLSLALIVGSTPGFARQQPIAVPFGTGPTLDGRVATDEWQHAAVQVLGDSSVVRLLHDERYLYVALQMREERLASLCVVQDAEVRILHTSMALGTAVYRRAGAMWRLVEPFAFGMRATDASTATQEKRRAFLRREGWVATTIPMGRPRHEIEYQISLDLVMNGASGALGITHLTMTPPLALVTSPPALDDDCGRPQLVQGIAPERARFDASRWLQLRLREAAQGVIE